MFEYDKSVSLLENYIRQVARLKSDAAALATYMEFSAVNNNGRVGSEEIIEDQRRRVKAQAEVVGYLQDKLGIKY